MNLELLPHELKYKLPELPKKTPPIGGWKPHTYYLVMASFRKTNPFAPYIFCSGFLDSDGMPGGYNFIYSTGMEHPASYKDIYALEVVGELELNEEYWG